MISVVIITKNEEKHIAKTLLALQHLTDDIVILDSGSIDNTVSIATAMGAKVFQIQWQGYGTTKNIGHTYAKYNWILSIDADEEVDEVLKNSIIAANYTDEDVVYKLKRVTHYCGKIISNGTFKAEYIPRLFHKENNYWNNELVHEKLISKNPIFKILKGKLIHYTIDNFEEHDDKIEKYATLAAEEMYTQHKKATWIKRYINPTIKFIKDFYIHAGFLEGKMGYIIAKKSAYATYLKYEKLRQHYANHTRK